jgi:hypothetical protein
LHVLQFVAQNHQEMVAECEGRDGLEEWIVCFIIASHQLVNCPQNSLQYSEALDTYFFLTWAKGANLLETPSPLLPTDSEY